MKSREDVWSSVVAMLCFGEVMSDNSDRRWGNCV